MKYCFSVFFRLIIIFSNLQLHAQESSNAFAVPAHAEIPPDGQALKGDIGEYDPVLNRTVSITSSQSLRARRHIVFHTEEDTLFIIYQAYAGLITGALLLNIKPVYMDADEGQNKLNKEIVYRGERLFTER